MDLVSDEYAILSNDEKLVILKYPAIKELVAELIGPGLLNDPVAGSVDLVSVEYVILSTIE